MKVMNQPNSKSAVIYARVSSVGQAEKELPIESQIQQCEKKAAELGCQIVRIFTDEGVSAKSDARPEFQNIISLCETAEIDHLITWNSSRFARNKVDASLYKRRLEKCGTKLNYASMDLDTSTDSGWLTDSIYEIFDEHYSRQVRSDTMRSMLKNAREGYFNGGPTPFGFQAVISPRNPKKKELAQVDAEISLVKTIYQKKRDDNMGIRLISIWLNERGYTNRGKKWTRSAALNVLKSRAVMGQTVFNRTERVSGTIKPESEWIIVNTHKPIIEAQLWNDVQKLIKIDGNKRESGANTRSKHLFTGISFCGECGSRMRSEKAKGRSATYHYYNCNAAWERKAHKNRRIPAFDLDDWLVAEVCAKIINVDSIQGMVEKIEQSRVKWSTSHRADKARIVSEIQRIEAANSKLYGLLESDEALFSLKDLSGRIKANNKRKQRFENELAVLEIKKQPESFDLSGADIRRLVKSMINKIVNTDNPAKVRAFLSSFIDKVIIDADFVAVFYKSSALCSSDAQNGSFCVSNGTPLQRKGRSSN